MSKDEITGQTIYNLQVRFINNDKSKAFIYPHRIKFYENDNCSADIVMPNIWFEHKDLDKYVADLEAKLAESEKENKAQLRTIKFLEETLKKPKEIRFNGFVVDCNYDEARNVLQEDILKMQSENKKLKESEELNNYAKCILENKKLEEDLELSEKCCVEYEEEISQLKQQLAEKDEQLKELTECNQYLQIYRNQDKISFAVEQLTLFKNTIVNKMNNPYSVNIKHILSDFDNQIEELKKEMK